MFAAILGILGAVAVGVGVLAIYLWYVTPNSDDVKSSPRMQDPRWRKQGNKSNY